MRIVVAAWISYNVAFLAFDLFFVFRDGNLICAGSAVGMAIFLVMSLRAWRAQA